MNPSLEEVIVKLQLGDRRDTCVSCFPLPRQVDSQREQHDYEQGDGDHRGQPVGRCRPEAEQGGSGDP